MIYGLSNYSPYSIGQIIEKFKKKQPNLRVTHLGFTSLELQDKTDVILVPTVRLLVNNMKKILKTKATVFVFDAPVVLEHLGVDILDVCHKENSFTYVFKNIEPKDITSRIGKEGKQELKKDRFNLLPTLLDKLKGSLSQNVLTFLYGVSRPENRVQYTKAIVDWLLAGSNDTEALGSELKKCGANDAAIERLSKFLGSEDGQCYVRAMKEIGPLSTTDGSKAKKPINYKALEKKYQIQSFDIKYLLTQYRSVISIETEEETTEDSYHKRDKHKKKKY